MSEDEKDYKVGYGKPPKRTQFERGQSGNPKGRPKGAKGVRASVRRELEAKITVRDSGREIRVSKAEALGKQLMATALKGNLKALAEILKLESDLCEDATGDGQMAARSEIPEAVDYDILRDFFETDADDEGNDDRETDNDRA